MLNFKCGVIWRRSYEGNIYYVWFGAGFVN